MGAEGGQKARFLERIQAAKLGIRQVKLGMLDARDLMCIAMRGTR